MTTNPRVSAGCALCRIKDEEILWTDGKVAILPTKTMKGHRARLMVMVVQHSAVVPSWLERHAVEALKREGRKAFSYAPRFVILSPFLGTVPHHWHYVATDLSPTADDFEQVMRTPWVEVVELL